MSVASFETFGSGSFGGPLGGSGGFWRSEEIEGVILEGEEIEGGHFGR